jgi:nucleoside-diphosphate-sugar epimerase
MHNILSAAGKLSTVKRIVFTQAGAAMVHPDDGDTLGTDMDIALNESTAVHPGLLSLAPPLASSHHAYCAAKAQCMTTLKNLRSSGELPFSIVQVIPGTVMGPSELVSTKTGARKHMDRMSRALLFNEPKPRYAFGFVDVEDCARVHVEALDEGRIPDDEIPDWFIAAGSSDQSKSGEEIWREASDVIESAFKNEVAGGMFTVGRDNVPTNMPYYVDSTLTETKLLRCVKFKSLNECVKNVAEWYRGLV